MKCVLFYQNNPLIDLDLNITPYKCEVKSAFIRSSIPKEFDDLKSPDGDLDLGKLSGYLSERVPHTIRCMSKLDLLQCLSLQEFEGLFSEDEFPKFLSSFLWHLETGDGISVYPKQTEYLCFTEQDERFKMVYRISEHV